MLKHITKENLLAGLVVAFFTFFIALMVSLGSQAVIRAMDNVMLAIILLLLIIFLGIFFDIIGTASTAADMPPLNAKAAKKIFGAKQAVIIVRNADKVANFCNDVIGDVAGTLSGAIGAAIVGALAQHLGWLDLVLFSALTTSFIAALTVGGKAVGKNVAVNQAERIIFRVGVIIAWWERITGIELFKNRR